MAGVEATIVHLIQKRIIRKFQDQCATDPRQAMTLESLNIKNPKIVKCLVKNKVLVGVSNDRFYLDKETAERYFKNKRLGAFIAFSLGIIIALIVMLLKK